MPPPAAGNNEQEAFLTRSHEVLKEYLSLQRLELPPGSLACYDPASDTLSLRSMNEVHEMVAAFSDAWVSGVPKQLSWRLEIVEAASADVRAAMQHCQGRKEHGKQLDDLATKGVIITTMRGEAKGGQQVTTRQGGGFNRPTSYITNASGQVQPEGEYAHTGVQLELDPVIGEDGSIDLNCFFQYWPAPPKPRLAQLTAGSIPKVEAEWMDLPAFTTKFSTNIQNGGTRLIGVWGLEALTDPAKAGRSQAAFLCAHAVKPLRLAEPRLEAMLRAHGEAAIPTPKATGPKADPSLPPGMMVRRFRVPPDFDKMSAGPGFTSPPNPDPFATVTSPANQTPDGRHQATAEDILKAQGIPFPPGSSAHFLRGTSELVVRNLPKNLDMVEAFGGGCFCCNIPQMVQATVEIIEADAALLRRLAREVEALPDHSAVQRALEAEIAAGKARVFRSAWIETKGGQQATWQNIIQTQTTAELGIGIPDPPKKEGEPEAKDAPSPIGGPGFYVHSEEEKVGFEIELDPVIGEDGIIDLNLRVTADTAPIGTLPIAAVPSEPGTQRLAMVNTERRFMEMKTSITLRKGIPRFITLYQPTTAEGPATNVLHAIIVRSDVISAYLPEE